MWQSLAEVSTAGNRPCSNPIAAEREFCSAWCRRFWLRAQAERKRAPRKRFA